MSEIKLYGDSILHGVTMPVASKLGIVELEARLLEAMKSAGGIGCSANQIGVPLSIFVMMLERGGTLTVINPEIISVDERTHIFEYDGCLSLPGVSAPTKRHDSITLKYQDINSDFHTSVFSGLESVIVQHELDHLNGKLYIDQLGKLKRSMLLKKYEKLTKKEEK